MSVLFTGNLSKNLDAVAVIMAGGSGTRFWPLSRSSRAKQYLPLASENESLLQATARRVQPLTGEGGVMVVTSLAQSKTVREQLPDAAVLAEPTPRNTAPCVAYAALKVLDECGDVPMLCLPADHVIQGSERILELYSFAVELVRKHDVLLTIGIRPTHPETGYGYIQREEKQNFAEQGTSFSAYPVARFVEKPDRKTAAEYLLSGDYFWNSGMFLWRPSVVLAAYRKYLPEMSKLLDEIAEGFSSSDGLERVSKLYAQLEAVSVDVGVMEKADNVVVVPGDGFGWSDVGSWDSWGAMAAEDSADAEGNVVRGEVALFGCQNSVVLADGKFIAGVGLEEMVVVETPDAILVCPRKRSQEVKDVVTWLKQSKRDDLL